MRYRSTAGQAPPVSLAEAVHRGLAPDGGLYLPEPMPRLPGAFFRELPGRPLAATARQLLAPYVGDELDAERLDEVVAETFSFPIPVTPLEGGIFLLELFHGPTLAFKDVGARFLARLLAALEPPGRDPAEPVTVLVATSGDTGGAVARAFHGVAGTRVVVLYPEGGVSPLQERQLATLGGNVVAVAVAGSFDDCQRLVKGAFADPALASRLALTSANSINIGRLLPQAVYYAHGVGQLPAGTGAPLVVVPSGNLGNLTAGILAERAGLPLRRFLAAVNANAVLPDYLASGVSRPRPSVATLANAMDVGDPSNLARLRDLFGDDPRRMGERIWASTHDDEAIRRTISAVHHRTGTLLDPHTAVGWLGLDAYRRATGDESPALLLATAHPAKFGEVVGEILGEPVPLPPALERCLGAPLERRRIPAEAAALERLLREEAGEG